MKAFYWKKVEQLTDKNSDGHGPWVGRGEYNGLNFILSKFVC